MNDTAKVAIYGITIITGFGIYALVRYDDIISKKLEDMISFGLGKNGLRVTW